MSDRINQIDVHSNPLSKEGLVGSVIEIKEKLAEMSNDMTWVRESLRRIEETLKTKAENDDITEIKKTLNDHERRLREAEKHNYKEIGMAMVGSALISSGIILLVLKALMHI